MKRIFYFLSVLILAACVTAENGYESYLAKRGLKPPETKSFQHCYGYGCQKISDITLSEKDWKKIAGLFKPAPKNAAAERERIAKAMGAFERIAGAQDGTDKDIAGTFRKTGEGQLDCVDESTNTTLYLSILLTKKLLRFHTLEGPTMRLPIINAGRWPHQTAVIRENGTGIRYAIDSWFQNNGAPADIIDLKAWKKGWKPDNVHGFL